MTPERRTLWPAEYYSSATPPPVLPRWASYGCGAASVVVLLVVFAGGAWLSKGGFIQLLDFTFGMTLGEMRGMYAKDVTAEQKKALESEIDSMRAGLRSGKVPVKDVQPVLQSLQKAIGDEKLTAKEVESVTAAARKAAQPRTQ